MTPGSLLTAIAPPTRLVGAPTPARPAEPPSQRPANGGPPPAPRPFSAWLRDQRGHGVGPETGDATRGADTSPAHVTGDDTPADAPPADASPATRALAPKPRASIPGMRRDGARSPEVDGVRRDPDAPRRDDETQEATDRTTGVVADLAAAHDARTVALAAGQRDACLRDGDADTGPGRHRAGDFDASTGAARGDVASDASTLASATDPRAQAADAAGRRHDLAVDAAIRGRDDVSSNLRASLADVNAVDGDRDQGSLRGIGAASTAGHASPLSGAATTFAAGPTGVLPSAANPASVSPLATPVSSPDFAASLGVQVSIFAQNGIQHAELHLNPAEMGPLTIRVELDGQAARVAFAADHAATRQVIESGLPALAGALADAGFTLAGGSVSARSRGDDAGAHEDRSGRTRVTGVARRAPVDALDASAPAARTVTVRAGGVDLYA